MTGKSGLRVALGRNYGRRTSVARQEERHVSADAPPTVVIDHAA